MRPHRAERLDQLRDILVRLLLCRLEQQFRLSHIGFKRRAIAAGEFQPVIFLRLHLIAHCAHDAFQLVVGLRFADRLGQGQQCIQLIELANLPQPLGLRF